MIKLLILLLSDKYDIIIKNSNLGGRAMFQVGDKIVYPMHGAGVIEDIEEREILGETQQYYVLNLSHSTMQVMVPMEKTSIIGIREVVDPDTLEKALLILHDGEPDDSVNRHQRYHLNMKKMKTGDICESAQVIRDLMFLNKNKKLGTEDKFMLDNARRIFISELILVKGFEEEQAIEFLDNAING